MKTIIISKYYDLQCSNFKVLKYMKNVKRQLNKACEKYACIKIRDKIPSRLFRNLYKFYFKKKEI